MILRPSTAFRLTICRYKHRLNHPGVHIPHGVQYKPSYNLPDEYADHPLYPSIRPKHPPGFCRLKTLVINSTISFARFMGFNGF